MRPWHWITGVSILCGYLLFPSGTAFEWTAVAVALLVGLVCPLLPRVSVEWSDVVAAVGAGAFFAAFGLLVRLLVNDLSLSDALLLMRRSEPVFGFLQPLGYWMLAWSGGASIALLARTWFSGGHPRVPH